MSLKIVLLLYFLFLVKSNSPLFFWGHFFCCLIMVLQILIILYYYYYYYILHFPQYYIYVSNNKYTLLFVIFTVLKTCCSDLACMKYRIIYNIIVSVFKSASRVVYYTTRKQKTLTKTLNACYCICFVSSKKLYVC